MNNEVVINLKECGTILIHILSNFDILDLYKTYYYTMPELFNNMEALCILSEKYKIMTQVPLTRFLDLLFEYDMWYNTNYVCCLGQADRLIYLIENRNIDNYLPMISSVDPEFIHEDTLSVQKLYYLLGLKGLEISGNRNKFGDHANIDTENLHLYDIGIKIASLDNNTDGNIENSVEKYLNSRIITISHRSKYIAKLCELGKIDELNEYLKLDLSEEFIIDEQGYTYRDELIVGALIGKQKSLLKGLLSIVDDNKDVKHVELSEEYPEEISIIKRLEFYQNLSFTSLEIFKELEELMTIDYYHVAINCCSYYGNYEIFIYVIDKLKRMNRDEIIDNAIQNNRLDILSYLLSQNNKLNINELLKIALDSQKLGSATIIWSKLKISSIDLCKIVAGDNKKISNIKDELLMNWLLVRLGPNEMKLTIDKLIEINDIKVKTKDLTTEKKLIIGNHLVTVRNSGIKMDDLDVGNINMKTLKLITGTISIDEYNTYESYGDFHGDDWTDQYANDPSYYDD